MKPILLASALLNLGVNAPAAAASTGWGLAATTRSDDNGGPAFSRALEDARGSAGAAAPPARSERAPSPEERRESEGPPSPAEPPRDSGRRAEAAGPAASSTPPGPRRDAGRVAAPAADAKAAMARGARAATTLDKAEAGRAGLDAETGADASRGASGRRAMRAGDAEAAAASAAGALEAATHHGEAQAAAANGVTGRPEATAAAPATTTTSTPIAYTAGAGEAITVALNGANSVDDGVLTRGAAGRTAGRGDAAAGAAAPSDQLRLAHRAAAVDLSASRADAALATLAGAARAAGEGTSASSSGPGFAAALVAAAGSSASTASAATAVAGALREAGIGAAPGSEGFAREVGAQVSVFVRDGVQQARLQLHPQELGPVLVRIQLEGQAAQVHLAAEQAFTRQALEQALPALAGQLSDAGFTLAGGGVFEKPPGAGHQRQAEPRPSAAAWASGEDGAGALDTPLAGAAAPRGWRARGIVDLVA